MKSDDVAELEWLSNLVEDSSNNLPSNSLTQTMYTTTATTTTLHSKSRSKRSRSNTSWSSSSLQHKPRHQDETYVYYNKNKCSSSVKSETITPRKCTHCASEKTPQWRTGPLGSKTLCNACGVRYKSGRLLPEYRPAASPTFVLTQHSNSHRKVMELRRQKQLFDQQQQGIYGNHYQVC